MKKKIWDCWGWLVAFILIIGAYFIIYLAIQ